MVPSTLLKLPLSWLRTLKVRLLLASVLVIASSVLTTANVLLARVELRSEQAVLDLESSHIEQKAALLGQHMVMLQKMMRAAAERMPHAAATDADEAIRFLAARMALTTTLDHLFVADARGHVVAVHDGQRGRTSRVDLAGSGFLRRTLEGLPMVSEPMPDPFGGQPVVVLTMPVLGPGHRVVAVFGGTMRLDQRNLLDELTFTPRGDRQQATTLLTDARGTIVAHPQGGRLLADAATEPMMAAAVARWVTQGRPVEPSAIVWRAEGQFVAIAGVPGPDWVLFRIVPDGQLLGGIQEAYREAMAWAAGVAVAGGGVILALLTPLWHPLARLRERVRRLDADDGVDDDWPRAAGEIGDLGAVPQRTLRERAAGERQQRALMAQLGSVMAAAPIGIAIARHRQFQRVSAEWCALLSWPEGALVGWPERDVFAAQQDYDALAARVQASFVRDELYAGEHEFRRRDGSHFWGRLTGRPVDAGTPGAGTMWLLEDATHQRAERERLAWSARHDGLTRLLNRAAFEERLRAHLDGGAPGVLLALDLDHFEQVNDAAGHAAGDRVLRAVAALLLQPLRGNDGAARLGGDEFALLLSPGDAAGGLALAQRLCEAIARPGVEHQGRWLGVGASIGVAAPLPAPRPRPGRRSPTRPATRPGGAVGAVRCRRSPGRLLKPACPGPIIECGRRVLPRLRQPCPDFTMHEPEALHSASDASDASPDAARRTAVAPAGARWLDVARRWLGSGRDEQADAPAVQDRSPAPAARRAVDAHRRSTSSTDKALASLLERLRRGVAHVVRHPGYGFAVLRVQVDLSGPASPSLHGAVLGRRSKRRLRQALRPGDGVVPLPSPGAFVAVLDGVASEAHLRVIVHRVMVELSKPYLNQYQSFKPQPRVGAVFCAPGQPPRSAEELLRRAEMALLDPDAERSSLDEDSPETRPLTHVPTSEPVAAPAPPLLRLEPQVELGVRPRVTALGVRLVGPGHDARSPGETESGDDDAQAAAQVERQLALATPAFLRWRAADAARAACRLALPAPAILVCRAGWADEFAAQLQRAGLVGADVQLDLPPTLELADPNLPVRLRALAVQGVALALDDFGTGQSSLSILPRLPVTLLKIDRGFVSQAHEREHRRVLLESTLRLAADLGMATLAKGLETPAQLALLRGLGCQRGEGTAARALLPPKALAGLPAAA